MHSRWKWVPVIGVAGSIVIRMVGVVVLHRRVINAVWRPSVLVFSHDRSFCGILWSEGVGRYFDTGP